jgi:uncharacterized protein involved in outer membrane biogenesis
MSNGLLYFGGLLVVVLSALFAVPNFIDWNGYRGVFEEEASKVLGRDVRVGGSVNLKLLPVPYVRFEKVRIANISGQTGEPFIRAESFTMWLSGPALLRGVLEASEVALNKPVLTLALDGKGGGNWSNIELKAGDLPFVPRDVALRSVKLIDGAVSIYNAGSERVALLEGIYGELSADGLRGPFRFKGSASWSGTAHDIAFATDAPSADGSFSLKAAARVDRSPNVYLLDGRVKDLSLKPTFAGDWSAKLAVPGSDAAPATDKDEPPLLDLKSHVTADALGAKFDDITLSLDNTAEPQTITGSATATWTASPRFDVALTSSWLDIDWLAGAGQGSAHFAKLKRLAIGLMQSVTGEGTAGAKINLAQVKIGGETAGGLSIDAERRSGITHFNTFKASLPGGSRLDLTGDLKDDEGKLSFSGNAFIGGTSLARLRSWAEKSGMAIDIQADGPFSAGGKVDIDATRFALADASGEISGRSLAGDLTITHDDRERTEATLQATELDTRDVFPKTTGALQAELRKALGLVPSDNQNPDDALPGDMRLRVVAGALTDGSETYRDVDVTFELEGSEIRLPAAKLTTANGLAIGLEGGIKTGNGRPVGTLAYDLVATTPEAMKDLSRKFGLSGIVGEERFKGAKDGKLAGLLRLGLRTPTAIDVTFDGTLNGARLSGSGEFDGGLSEWRSRPSRVQASFNTPSLPVLLTALGRDTPTLAGGPAAPAQASIVATGTVGSGAETRVEVTSQGLAMTFAGRTTWPEDSGLALKGAVDLKAGDFTDALSVVGISLPTGSAGIATHGTLDLTRDKDVWTVATRNLALGTATLTGEVKVAANAAGAQHIEGEIGTDRLPVGSLLSALIDKSSVLPAVTGAASSSDNVAALETRSIWPDGLFNFDAVGSTEANIQLRFQSLDLSGNLATRDGALQLALGPGKLTVSNLAADAAGGRLVGELKLEKALGGVSLTTKLKLDQAKLASLSPAAKGYVTVALDAEARAQSPAGLVAVMTGLGSVKLVGAEIPGPGVAALPGVVDTVLHGKLQNDPRTLAAALTTTLNTSKLIIGDRDFAMKVTDGSVKFDTVALNATDGKVEATTAADLTSLNFNAACQLTSMVRPLPPPPIPLPGWTPPPPKAPLPPAIVLYNGQLDNLVSVKTNVDIADLQRELVVRQMERNVEELELSRRVDEERARLEKERRKAAEEQRAAAIAAARAQKQAERLPPVIPESAGTANPVTPIANPATPSPAPAATPDAQAAPTTPQTQPGAPPPPAAQAQQQPEPRPSDSGNTVLTPKILIEPIPPPPGGSTQGDATGQVPAIDPQTGLPVVAKDQPTARPTTARSQRPDQSRRTSSDEVMRALGGYP